MNFVGIALNEYEQQKIVEKVKRIFGVLRKTIICEKYDDVSEILQDHVREGDTVCLRTLTSRNSKIFFEKCQKMGIKIYLYAAGLNSQYPLELEMIKARVYPPQKSSAYGNTIDELMNIKKIILLRRMYPRADISDIRKEVERLGIRTKRGGHWDCSGLKRLIEKYDSRIK